jgi:hypothetical protein
VHEYSTQTSTCISRSRRRDTLACISRRGDLTGHEASGVRISACGIVIFLDEPRNCTSIWELHNTDPRYENIQVDMYGVVVLLVFRTLQICSPRAYTTMKNYLGRLQPARDIDNLCRYRGLPQQYEHIIPDVQARHRH